MEKEAFVLSKRKCGEIKIYEATWQILPSADKSTRRQTASIERQTKVATTTKHEHGLSLIYRRKVAALVLLGEIHVTLQKLRRGAAILHGANQAQTD